MHRLQGAAFIGRIFRATVGSMHYCDLNDVGFAPFYSIKAIEYTRGERAASENPRPVPNNGVLRGMKRVHNRSTIPLLRSDPGTPPSPHAGAAAAPPPAARPSSASSPAMRCCAALRRCPTATLWLRMSSSAAARSRCSVAFSSSHALRAMSGVRGASKKGDAWPGGDG